MQRLLKEASIEAGCQDELTIHMQKMYEYEHNENILNFSTSLRTKKLCFKERSKKSG